MIRLRMHLSGSLPATLAQLRRTLPQRREEQTRALAQEVLHDAAARTPVRTGRAQRSWLDAAAAAGGSSAGRADSDAETQSSGHQTTVSAVNTVPYIHYLEYGTRRMAPRPMIRPALATGAALVSRFFRVLLMR